jgi:hypothetical protein
MTEEETLIAEEEFPKIAHMAFKAAFDTAISSGQKVLVAGSGELIELSPEGRRKIKDLEPDTYIGKGTVFQL